METEDIETKEDIELTVDFSRKSLKRVERAKKEHQSAVSLILDHNEIQKLDNLETYPNLKKLSLVNNQLVRMYSLSNLVHLVILDLSQNSLMNIEGLKVMTELKILKLAGNKIKTIEHLSNNLNLNVLDLSENSIMRISDISYLLNLKELYLHGNRIINLSQCEKKLPITVEVLTLSDNSLTDLNEVSHLSCLTSLKELTLRNNPCSTFSANQKFNYRPFVKNWCSNLLTLDYTPLDDIECLKAEWLYSQGRGRSFKVGEHAALIEYLISVCPLKKEESAETEDSKKLKLILSKAQLYQQQLREQLTAGSAKLIQQETLKSPVKKKSAAVSERMTSSFQESPAKDLKNSCDLMTQSLDSGVTKKSLKASKFEANQTPLQASTAFVPIPDTLISPDVCHPIGMISAKPSSVSSRTSRSSSRNSPLSTPENKRKASSLRKQLDNLSIVSQKTREKLNYSTSCFPTVVSGGKTLVSKGLVPFEKKAFKSKTPSRNYKETSEEEEVESLSTKLKSFQLRLSQRKQNKVVNNMKKLKNVEEKKSPKSPKDKLANFLKEDAVTNDMLKAAICIQRRWRGYRARNLNEIVLSGYKSIQVDRIQNYLKKVMVDVDSIKVALEGNRKLVVLQMQAINALWKKTASLQAVVSSPPVSDKSTLEDLFQTCSNLNKQVEALQAMMKSFQDSSVPPLSVPIGTQTEIVAVRTPQDDLSQIFPCNRKVKSVHSECFSIDLIENQQAKVNEKGLESENELTEVATAENFSNGCVNKKDSSTTFFKSDLVDEKEFSFTTENLTKPSVNLSQQNNEVPPASEELDRMPPQTMPPVQNTCES